MLLCRDRKIYRAAKISAYLATEKGGAVPKNGMACPLHHAPDESQSHCCQKPQDGRNVQLPEQRPAAPCARPECCDRLAQKRAPCLLPQTQLESKPALCEVTLHNQSEAIAASLERVAPKTGLSDRSRAGGAIEKTKRRSNQALFILSLSKPAFIKMKHERALSEDSLSQGCGERF